MAANKQNQIKPIQQVSQGLATMEKNIGLSLPASIPSERFMRIAQTAIQDPIIAEKINQGKCDKSSLYDSVQKCAQDGLVLDKREAALVCFWDKDTKTNKVQYMPMVAGIQKKVWNSDQLESLTAHVVYANDKFSYELGDNEHIQHIPCDDEDPGEMIKVYAIAKLKGGGIQRVVMNKRQVMKHAAMAKTKMIWNAWPEEQWEKTAIKKLAKRLPQSSDLDRVFQADNETINLDEAEDATFVDTETGETSAPAKPEKKTTTRAASKIKAKTKPKEEAKPPIESTATEVVDDSAGMEGQDGDPGFSEEDII